VRVFQHRVRVAFPLSIEIVEARAPEYLKVRTGGRDEKVDGLVKAELEVHLVEAGGATDMRLTTDLTVLGRLGTLGHSAIVRKGDEVLGTFAGALRAQLEH